MGWGTEGDRQLAQRRVLSRRRGRRGGGEAGACQELSSFLGLSGLA